MTVTAQARRERRAAEWALLAWRGYRACARCDQLRQCAGRSYARQVCCSCYVQPRGRPA